MRLTGTLLLLLIVNPLAASALGTPLNQVLPGLGGLVGIIFYLWLCFITLTRGTQ